MGDFLFLYLYMKTIYNGSQILVKAALDAGCEYFAGYPITPAAKILEYFSKHVNKSFKFLQAEDEVAAIHSIIGASLAGKKVMTATSGPGFSLMQEGIGLAFASSVPLVIVDVMRQGPSTGMPTKPSQGDILQTQYGTHGDYKSVVFYPNSLPDIYNLTLEAFNTAEKISSPVIILLDAALINLYETVELPKKRIKKIKHILEFGKSSKHLSGLVTDNDGLPQTDNYEIYKDWIKEKFSKISSVSNKFNILEYTNKNNSKNLVIAYGFVSRLIRQSSNYDTLIVKKLFPIEKRLRQITKTYKKIIVIEMNEGQYTFALQSFFNKKLDQVKIYGSDLDPDRILKSINEKL